MEHKKENHQQLGEEILAEEFVVAIEDKHHKWHKATITVLEIRELGKIPKDQKVVCEDEEGCERTLEEIEIITIKPGHRHGRAPKYKRG